VPRSFAFVHLGLFRGYVLDEKGGEYNKSFFTEGRFPGAMTALLRQESSRFTIDALEDSAIIEIDHAAYRRLLQEYDDLKLYHIHYLERHWLLDKDAREVALVQEDAASRYQCFLRDFPDLAARLPQYHIASHLGITPTQLSRIRKKR
jgi:CRP-like cAMP-binding protein